MYSNKKGEVTNVSVRRVSHIPHGLKCSLFSPHLPALNFHVRAFCFFSTEEGNVGSDSQETDNVHACGLKDKSTFTHKVQVSANRTATGVALPIGLTDQNAPLQFHDSTFRFFHVPSDRPFLVESTYSQREDASLPLFSPLPADSLRHGGVMSLLRLLETQTLFPPEWKCQLTSC